MRATVSLVLVSALWICAFFVQPGLARDLPLTLVALTSPVRPGGNASVTVQTDPRTQCMLLVHYKTRAAEANLALPKRADKAGRVSWTWRIAPNAVPGAWPVIVHCHDEFKGSVEQRRLDLSLTVG